MLWNPKWKKPETKADPFTLESLIAWLEKQPAHIAYDYTDSSNCLLCQYFRAQGFNVNTLSCGGFDIKGSRAPDITYPYIFCKVSNAMGSETFGAALNRARTFAAGA